MATRCSSPSLSRRCSLPDPEARTAPGAPPWLRAVAAAVLLGAFAVRLYRLDGQSLWYDEGFSAHVALGDFASIFGYAGMDPHPPLYHLLLWGWAHAAGGSEFALRFLSVVSGTLAVALLYRLGATLGSPAWGAAAAVLAVANPFLVHYSQEARMYALFTALALLATVCLVRAVGGSAPAWSRPWWWYTLVTAALLLAHYFAAFLVVAHGLWAVLTQRGTGALWLRHTALALLLGLPWYGYAAPLLLGYQTVAPSPLEPATALQQVLVAFTTGVVPPDWPGGIATRLAPAAALGGLVALAGQRRHAQGLLLVLGFAAPLAGLYLLSLERPTFNPRYVIAALPFLLLMAAALPVAFAPRVPAVGLALAVGLAVPFVPPLQRALTSPELARDNWRALAAFVEQRAQPDDVFVFNAWYAQFVFDYYARGPQPRLGAPREGPLDADGAASLLNRAVGQGRRVWLVLWQDEVVDPGGYLPATAEAGGRVVEQHWLGSLRAFAYEVPAGSPPFRPVAPAQPVAGDLAGEIALEGYSVDRTDVRPGDTLRVTLFWRSRRRVDQDYWGFVHLLSRDLRVFGQLDKVTIGYYYPTSRWRPGQLLRDEYAFQVLPEAPPGEYLLEVGMYTQPDGQRRPVLGPDGRPAGDSILLPQRVVVLPR